MTKRIKQFHFKTPESAVGHTVVCVPTRAGKTTFVSLLEVGHPGGSMSVMQAGPADSSRVQAKGAALRTNTPYYRQFDKRR
jgi:hypothetical protein